MSDDIYEFSFTIENATEDYVEHLLVLIKDHIEFFGGKFNGGYFNQTEEKENKEDE